MNKTIETIAHRAADEIVNTAKQDVDRVEVIVLQAIRDGIKEVDETWRDRFRKFNKIEEKFGPATVTKTGKKNPNRGWAE